MGRAEDGDRRDDTFPYSAMTAAEVMARLQTRAEGLTEEEAASRLAHWGPNVIGGDETSRIVRLIVDQFKDPLIYLLLASAAATGFLRQYVDMWVILAAVVINAIIGFIQEYRADQSMKSLARLAAPKAKVVRGGITRETDAASLVPGDIVLLRAGDRVPADIRLIEVTRLEAEEAALTGESTGVEKSAEPVPDGPEAAVGQRNAVYMGTTIVSGRGKGVVVATGSRTTLGQISEAVRSTDEAVTPLQVQLAHLGRSIGIAAIVLALLTVVLAAMAGISFTDGILTAIALTVAIVPEGLPIVVTVTLAVGARRMARRNAIVRRLPAVETLGSCTVILSDKTGTLTQNEMTVREIHTPGRRYIVSGAGYDPGGHIRLHSPTPSFALEAGTIGLLTPPTGEKTTDTDHADPASDLSDTGPDHADPASAYADAALTWTLRIGLLANESRLSFKEDRGFVPYGDPTEAALITAARKGGLGPEEEGAFEKLDEIPFESERRYMATLVRHRSDGTVFIMVKGAVERVLAMCTHMLDESGTPVPATPEARQRLLDAAGHMARRGLRVLAMAYREMEDGGTKLANAPLEGLIVTGIQGMMDPPRPEAKEAIRRARQAGIEVKMVTGDHKDTAAAIARELGISSPAGEAVTGRDLQAMDDDVLDEKLGHVRVFARVSPLDKLRLVRRLLAHNEVVAVTGDGVNDAPALKAAHIGVAMGITGTDTAKEASDMIVADDNFASIFAAVEEGRTVFANIRKVIFFLLPTGLGVVLTIFCTLLARWPLPFLPAQILWLNLATNGLQDVALSLEPGEPGLAKRPPRDPEEPIMGRLMLQRFVLVGIVLAVGTVYVFQRQLASGVPLAQAQTVTLTTAVLFQMFHVFNCRSEHESVFRIPWLGNPPLLASLVIALGAHLLVIYHPTLQFVFRTAPIRLAEWALIVPIAATIIPVIELDKWLRRRSLRARPATG